MFVLAHLSDLHIGPLPAVLPWQLVSKRGLGFVNWTLRRRRMHSRRVLAAILEDIKAQAPAHIAVTGDLVNLSLPAEFVVATKVLTTLGPGDGVTVVPGNHDAYVTAAEGFAAHHWAAYMRADATPDKVSFPYVRRRGPLALVGVSTSVATAPLSATGRVGTEQAGSLRAILKALAGEELMRVVLIHHPPYEAGMPHDRRLVDAGLIMDVLAETGAELVLHGHNHTETLERLAGPKGTSVPVVGCASASSRGTHREPRAGYGLIAVEGAPGAWKATLIRRGLDGADQVIERERVPLAG